MLDIPINQAVNDLGFVPWGGILQEIPYYTHLMLLDLYREAGTTHAISVDDYLLREGPSIGMILVYGRSNELLNDFGPFNCDFLFLLVP